ncbi:MULTISPECIES: hypothetical protein [unclassified Flavobacterium]|uniref:hypothetical protein n=1 Tax=unclassified Flavobacterium TaxID=196869 RepID=UPI001F12A7BC|nr:MULTISPECIES: hypothetical protein [unclassified Flavobacterium]UMY65433.1 hypothetical protein MKO97_13110 [Flavobacterium sp. HJ-32-4]
MEEFIIIRAGVNGGKTTTCGYLYEQLSKTAQYSKLFSLSFNEIRELKYNEDGGLYDFIGVIIINGKVIIIISQGDVAEDLEKILNKLKDGQLIKKLTDGLSDIVHFLVVTGRSQMRTNSTIMMLHNRIPSDRRKEFWTEKSKDLKDKLKVKDKIVTQIIKYIGSK